MEAIGCLEDGSESAAARAEEIQREESNPLEAVFRSEMAFRMFLARRHLTAGEQSLHVQMYLDDGSVRGRVQVKSLHRCHKISKFVVVQALVGYPNEVIILG